MRMFWILGECLCLIGTCFVSAQAAHPTVAEGQGPADQIDFAGFLELADEVQPIREKRRVALDKFQKMARDKSTLILDTRSKTAYDEVHWEGARHLNFSDFTAEKLAKFIPNKNTRILIYCNNNFETPPMESLATKSAPLALNIPTFVNLYGYGYKNVFELRDVLEVDDPRVNLVGTAVKSRASQIEASREVTQKRLARR